MFFNLLHMFLKSFLSLYNFWTLLLSIVTLVSQFLWHSRHTSSDFFHNFPTIFNFLKLFSQVLMENFQKMKQHCRKAFKFVKSWIENCRKSMLKKCEKVRKSRKLLEKCDKGVKKCTKSEKNNLKVWKCGKSVGGRVENPIHDPNPLLAGWPGSSACMGWADGHLGPWVKGWMIQQQVLLQRYIFCTSVL